MKNKVSQIMVQTEERYYFGTIKPWGRVYIYIYVYYIYIYTNVDTSWHFKNLNTNFREESPKSSSIMNASFLHYFNIHHKDKINKAMSLWYPPIWKPGPGCQGPRGKTNLFRCKILTEKSGNLVLFSPGDRMCGRYREI